MLPEFKCINYVMSQKQLYLWITRRTASNWWFMLNKDGYTECKSLCQSNLFHIQEPHECKQKGQFILDLPGSKWGLSCSWCFITTSQRVSLIHFINWWNNHIQDKGGIRRVCQSLFSYIVQYCAEFTKHDVSCVFTLQ